MISKLSLSIFMAISLFSYSNCKANNGFSIDASFDYYPVAKLSYINSNIGSYEYYDNMTYGLGVNYHFASGFGIGASYDIYRKELSDYGNSHSRLSINGVTFSGDYGYEITESGNLLLMAGIEMGLDRFTDQNDVWNRSKNAFNIGGLGGLRYFIKNKVYADFDVVYRWNEYSIKSNPKMKYQYSGTVLKLSIGWLLFSRESKILGDINK